MAFVLGCYVAALGSVLVCWTCGNAEKGVVEEHIYLEMNLSQKTPMVEMPKR